MAFSASFAAMIEDALSPLGKITVKRIFGSGGVYCDGILFAIASDDVLYFKVDAETRPDFETEGSRPFTVHMKTRPTAMPYWSVPERLYDETDELLCWARKAIGAARQAIAARPDRATGTTSRAAKARRRSKA